MTQDYVKSITKKSENFSEWYNDVILKAELADYGPAKGTMVIRPYGYAIWERIQAELDRVIKEAGVSNAYFPLFIPEKLLHKEKEHVEGFSPELAVVTVGGGEELAEPLVVRPTSETIIYSLFAKWISSWRDLPYKINQWCNVVRWEKRPYLFLRTTEFLWQEGHTAHETHKEAKEEVFRALKSYRELYRNLLAIDGVSGMKSQEEKFAGAENTYTFEILIPDGKILQGCTSHDLGQNFSKPFEITFQDKSGQGQFVWQTSWGLSTRSIGGLIMVHGDDRGLVLPPRVAPIQVVIIPIPSQDAKTGKAIAKLCLEIKDDLEKGEIRVKVDSREEQSPGWKFNEWELKGVPVRLEVGSRELESGELVAVRRDSGDKIKVPKTQVRKVTAKLLEDIQDNLLGRSEIMLRENTREVETYDEFKELMGSKRGFISAFWCKKKGCEERIKVETKATVRCLPFDYAQGKPSGSEKQEGTCICCGKKAGNRWLFGQSY
ncbi:MAG: proline--tRNA ligase [bacterium]|nr:proline--tRNA ligase [bacterium]